MNHYVGIDVFGSSERVRYGCNGKIVREGKIANEPDALIHGLQG
jgi:hypothetical protein